LTHAQVEALAKACARPTDVSKHRRLDERENQAYRLVVLFLAYTGVRFGEMAALRVSRLDLTRRRATISESVTVVRARGWSGAPPNLTNAGRCRSHGSSSPSCKTHRRQGARRARVQRRTGRRATTGADLPRRLPRGATAIGIPELHPHELRHTAASLAIASGADVKVVQQMLGHSSAAATMDVYGHLFSDRLDEVADALDNARSEAAKSAVAVANAQNPVAKVLPNADVVDLAAYEANGKTAGQTAISDGAPGEIRTRAPASGGRCSIP
jgi:integrase